MTRKEFVRICGLLGLSIPFGSTINACNANNTSNITPNKVLIIGSGAAGMTAGYLLQQQGVDFQIIESSSTFGGRIKHTKTFADFPISLGGEWIHVPVGILSEIINNSSIQITTQTVQYNDNDSLGVYDGSNLTLTTLQSGFGEDYSDLKFINSSWLDFFETYIYPNVQSKVIFNSQVISINSSSDQVNVTDSNVMSYTADKVIITVPLKQLQNQVINFTPTLPPSKLNAIQNLKLYSGFKAFFKFSSKFYPTFLTVPDSETNEGQRLFYDASYGQNSNQHVLGIFSVGKQAESYQNLSDSDFKNNVLNELDTIFGGSVASNSYLEHISQNWNTEPFINSAYLTDTEDWRLVRELGRSIDDKLYFAGDSYTDGEDWGSVHAAARSAIKVIEEILG